LLCLLLVFLGRVDAAEAPAPAEATAPTEAAVSAPDGVEAQIPLRQVTLDADTVVYEDETGRATAEGGAVLSYGDAVTIEAERIDYDAVSNKVKASPMPGESVLLRVNDAKTGEVREARGDGLQYDMNTGEGVMTGVKTSAPIGSGTLYIYGGSIQVMPYDMAESLGMVRRRGDATHVIIWDDAVATTCALEHPHYRLESKRVIFTPGRVAVAKKPRIYLGNTYILTYPMDYIIRIDRLGMKRSIFPYVQRSSEKGTGGGLSGAFSWNDRDPDRQGSIALGLAYWSDANLEWTAELEQGLGGGFGVMLGSSYAWHSAWSEKIHTVRGSLYYDRYGWRVFANWIDREYIGDQKDAFYKYEGYVTRHGELSVLTPWFRDKAFDLGWFRLGASWGRYSEEFPPAEQTDGTVMRYGPEARSYVEVPLSSSFPRASAPNLFWNIRYNAWFYDDADDMNQEVLRGFMGIRWRLGAFELGSGYERRFAWGSSPMEWDQYYGYDAEKVRQKVRFPLGKEVFLAAQGSYDFNGELVDQAYYALQWITDCMKWELSYLDDRTSGDDDYFTLHVSLNALPRTPSSFGQYRFEDPFERPWDLPMPQSSKRQ
jgi:LPS-assembly protein